MSASLCSLGIDFQRAEEDGKTEEHNNQAFLFPDLFMSSSCSSFAIKGGHTEAKVRKRFVLHPALTSRLEDKSTAHHKPGSGCGLSPNTSAHCPLTSSPLSSACLRSAQFQHGFKVCLFSSVFFFSCFWPSTLSGRS